MKEAEPNLAEELQRVRLFSAVAPGVLETLARACSRRRMKRGEQVYRQGDTPRALYYVQSGYVRRAIASFEGDEKVIDVVGPGQECGLAELFGVSPYGSFAEVVEPAVVLEIGKDALMRAMEEDRQLAMHILAAVSEGRAMLEKSVAAFFFQSGSRRLLDYLLREAGELDPQRDTEIDLPVSKSLIADLIGVSAETLSRAFRELSDAGLIAVRGKRVTLLQKLAARRAQAGQPGTGVPPERERRRTDPWVERAAMPRPVGSRAWL